MRAGLGHGLFDALGRLHLKTPRLHGARQAGEERLVVVHDQQRRVACPDDALNGFFVDHSCSSVLPEFVSDIGPNRDICHLLSILLSPHRYAVSNIDAMADSGLRKASRGQFT
jgi:hypothetical protein